MSGGMGKNAINKLGEAEIQAFIRKAKSGQAERSMLSDGGGMYLEVLPSGTPVWRVAYRLNGKERTYTIGPLTSFPLAEARKERESVKALVREGRDPVQDRQIRRAEAVASSGETFAALAAEWLAKERKGWSAIHYEKSSRALERDVFPKLGKLPVASIKPLMVAGVIEEIVDRGEPVRFFVCEA